MKTYLITTNNNLTCEVSADLHYTDGEHHLFYTYEEGLILCCDISVIVTEM